MKGNSLGKYEKSYLALIALILIQIFLVFINIYNTQSFSIESFSVVIIQLLAISLAYFLGIVPGTIFSLVYLIGYIVYIIQGEKDLNLITYIMMFFLPLVTIYAGNMNRMRREIIYDLSKLNKLEEIQVKIDPYTRLENETAFKEVLSKQSNLAERYSNYYFSVFMFRLEFVSTLKVLLDVKDFNRLLGQIADSIQNSIREEDYKFILNNDRFAIITPLTSVESISPAIRRILESVEKLNIEDKQGKKIDLVLKAGGLDHLEENQGVFRDYDKLLIELQKATEVDIHGEYVN